MLLAAVACTALLLYTAYDANNMGETVLMSEVEMDRSLLHNVAHKVRCLVVK